MRMEALFLAYSPTEHPLNVFWRRYFENPNQVLIQNAGIHEMLKVFQRVMPAGPIDVISFLEQARRRRQIIIPVLSQGIKII